MIKKLFKMSKMKSNIFLFFFLISLIANAQTEKFVIEKSLEKNKQINAARYIMYQVSKLNGMRDTAYETGSVVFQKDASDTLLGMQIKIENYKGLIDIYNGKDFIKIRRSDSAVYIWNAANFNSLKYRFLSDKFVFFPYIKTPNVLSELLTESNVSLKFLKDTSIEGQLCYVIAASKIEQEKGQPKTQVNQTFFFRKDDYLIVGYTQKIISAADLRILKYEKVMLENIMLNSKIDSAVFNFNAVLPNYAWKQQTSQNIKNYIVIEDAINDLKPELISKIKSTSYLKNKNLLVILINDTNCYPCENTLSLIDSIYNSIKHKVTPMIITTSAPKENFGFLKEEQKHFPEFYECATLLNESQINTFPTFYILDKQLNIIYKSEGYSNQLRFKLAETINSLNE